MSGGAIYAVALLNFDIIGSSFTNNTAGSYAGAVFMQSSAWVLEPGVIIAIINGSSFRYNHASVGGAIVVRSSEGVMTAITNSKRDEYNVTVDPFLLSNSEFIRNTATIGGAIAVFGYAGLEAVYFADNSASQGEFQ